MQARQTLVMSCGVYAKIATATWHGLLQFHFSYGHTKTLHQFLAGEVHFRCKYLGTACEYDDTVLM